jgi:hypothetical protein
MNLQEKLAAYKADFISRVPPETVRIIERATRELESSEIIGKVLKKGDQAPGFTLSDHNGQAFISEQLLARGPLIVSFYRGGW